MPTGTPVSGMRQVLIRGIGWNQARGMSSMVPDTTCSIMYDRMINFEAGSVLCVLRELCGRSFL